MTIEKEMLTPREAAALLGVHTTTLKRNIPIAPFIRVGTRGDRRYRREDIQAYLDAHAERP